MAFWTCFNLCDMKKSMNHKTTELKQLCRTVKLLTKQARKLFRSTNDKTNNWKPVRKKGAIKY